MIAPRLKQAILEQLDQLPEQAQQRVLDYANALVQSAGQVIAGRELLRFRGKITKEDLISMETAIEEGCERVDVHEW